MERVSCQVALRLIEAGEHGQRVLDVLNRAPSWFEHFLRDPASVQQNGRRGATKKALLLLGLAVLGGVAVPSGYRALQQFFQRNNIPFEKLEESRPAIEQLSGLQAQIGKPEFDFAARSAFDRLRNVANTVTEPVSKVTPDERAEETKVVPDFAEESQQEQAQQPYSMTATEIQELAEVVFAENARNWQNDTMNAAIAWIALNRRNAEKGLYANQDTLHEVLTAPAQFQGENSPARRRLQMLINNDWIGPDPRTGVEMELVTDRRAFEKILQTVNDVASGRISDPTNGALHYGHASDQAGIRDLNDAFGKERPRGNIRGVNGRHLYFY